MRTGERDRSERPSEERHAAVEVDRSRGGHGSCGRSVTDAIAIAVVGACLVLGCAALVASLMHAWRQPVTELRETVAVPGSLRLGDIEAALRGFGWQVTDRELATGEIAAYGGDLTFFIPTVVEAPRRGDGAGSLLFIYRQTARTAPSFLRISLRPARKGSVADLAMRGWGDGFITAWICRRRFRSASARVAALGRGHAPPAEASSR